MLTVDRHLDAPPGCLVELDGQIESNRGVHDVVVERVDVVAGAHPRRDDGRGAPKVFAVYGRKSHELVEPRGSVLRVLFDGNVVVVVVIGFIRRGCGR